MTRVLSDVAKLLSQIVPPWALLPALLLLGLAAVPVWLRMVRARQIGGRIRRMVRAEPADREQLANEVLELAGDRDALLLTAAEQAIRYDQRGLRDRVIAALDARGTSPAEVAHLRSKTRASPAPIGHPLEIAGSVERLVEQGLHERARERLEAGRKRYPDDPDLLALERRLSEPPPDGQRMSSGS